MQAHVRGYYVIARRVASTSQATAVGAGPSEARSRLDKTIAGLSQDVNIEYQRQKRMYDAVTDNGRSQDQGPGYGFPGGPGASAYCAR